MKTIEIKSDVNHHIFQPQMWEVNYQEDYIPERNFNFTFDIFYPFSFHSFLLGWGTETFTGFYHD